VQVVHTFNRDIAKQGTVEDLPDDTAKMLIRTGRARPATEEEISTGADGELASDAPPAAASAPLAAPAGAAPPASKATPPAGLADTEGAQASKAKPEKPGDASAAPTTNK
jgi:hypothetical protein